MQFFTDDAPGSVPVDIQYIVHLGYNTLTGTVGDITPHTGNFTSVKSQMFNLDSSEVLLGKNVGGIKLNDDHEGTPTILPHESNYNVFIGNNSGKNILIVHSDTGVSVSKKNVFIGGETGCDTSGNTGTSISNSNVFIGY